MDHLGLAPTLSGDNPQPRHVLTRNRTSNLSFTGQLSNQLGHMARALSGVIRYVVLF